MTTIDSARADIGMPIKNTAVSKCMITALALAFSFTCVAAVEDFPRVGISALKYQGAFRIPSGDYGVSNANYSYGAIAYNPDKNSIFLAGHANQGAVAEFKIPEIVNSTVLSELAFSGAPIQNFSYVTNRAQIYTGEGIRIAGMFYNANKLLVNVYRFYDQSPFLQTPTLIFDDASKLSSSKVHGYLSFGGGSRAAGWVSPIPVNWQSRLGGTHIGGLTSTSERAIIYNSSVGPAAYAFNPIDAMTNSATVSSIPTKELMYYTLQNGLVANAEALYSAGQLWTHLSEGSFGMIIPGTRTYVVLGGSGGHKSGMAYGNPPYGGYKGHYTIDQYDKSPYYWLYDVTELEKVAKGQKAPYDLLPYASGPFNAPFQTDVINQISGGSYDKDNGILYVSIYRADNAQGGGTNPPVIAAYKFDAPSPIQTLPAPEMKPVK